MPNNGERGTVIDVALRKSSAQIGQRGRLEWYCIVDFDDGQVRREHCSMAFRAVRDLFPRGVPKGAPEQVNEGRSKRGISRNSALGR